MLRMLVGLVIAAVAWTAVSSCQRRKKQPKDQPRQVRVLPRPVVPMATLSEELIGQGQAPRELIRYQALPTRKQTLKVAAQVRLSEKEDSAKAVLTTLPTIRTSFELGWVGGDGDRLKVTAAPAVVDGDPGPPEAKARELMSRYQAMLAGRPAEVPVSNRGSLGHRPVADDAAIRVREYVAALADFVIAFPEGPIGVGGEWRISRAVPRASTNVEQVVRFNLLARNGNKLTVSVVSKLVAERQPLDVPGLGPGMRAELLALRSTYEGTVTVDLRMPAAVGGQLVKKDVIHTQSTRGGQPVSSYYSESTATISISTR